MSNNLPHLDQSSFGLISQVCQSDLSFRVKNDIICRILALRYDVGAVSLLLYDGQKDVLINRGNYVNADWFIYQKVNKNEKSKREHMLKYISFYDFLYYKFYHSGIPAILNKKDIDAIKADFNAESNKHFNYCFDNAIITNQFVKDCHLNSIDLASSPDLLDNQYYKLSKKSFYYLYKRGFTTSEEYVIGPKENNYSGRIFWMVLTGRKHPNIESSFVYNDEIFDESGELFTVSDDYNNFFKTIKSCNLNIDVKFKYCGIPLWYNGRCLGVIRLLTKETDEFIFRNNLDRRKSIRHATEIIANFADQWYSQEFVDGIIHEWEDETETASNKRDKYCSSLRKAMDSYGCILRLSDLPGNEPIIAGKSTDSVGFADFVNNYLVEQKLDNYIVENKFNRLLGNCFASTHHFDELIVKENFRLIGIAIDFDEKDIAGKFKKKFYYCHKGSERVKETSESYIFKNNLLPEIDSIFHPTILKVIRRIPTSNTPNNHSIRVRHVLIVDIPALDVEGLVTFANTQNRPFNITDVRFAYGEMKRFGLELSRTNKERLKSYKEIAGTYFHDLKNIIKICVAQSRHLISLCKPASKEIIDAGNLIDFLRLTKNKIINFQRFAMFNMRPTINRYQQKEWSLDKTILSFCQMLNVIGLKYKSTGVLFKSNISDQSKKTNINQDIIELCLFNLLENAMKYSYGKSSKSNVPGFNINNLETDGHVHVILKESEDDYMLSITNWGCEISDTDKIFEKSERPIAVDLFCTNENPALSFDGGFIKLWQTGTRIGLYAVNKFIHEIGGHCICQHELNKTTFTLTFPKNIV